MYYTYLYYLYVLYTNIHEMARFGVYKGQYSIVYTYIYINIYKKSFPRAVNWGITDHVAPCLCRLLLETALARLLIHLVTCSTQYY